MGRQPADRRTSPAGLALHFTTGGVVSCARSISLASALAFVLVSLICGPIRAASAPPPPRGGGSGKPTDKTTVQPKSGSGLDQKTIDEEAKKIQAAEGDTAG